MTSNFDDHLSRQLNALNTDVSNAQMAGPAAARRRAAQRTRNQVTGAVLTGIAVIALGFAGAIQDDLFTAPDPAEPTSTESPTAVPTTPDEPDSTENPTPPPDATIPESAFLTVDDITPELEPGDSFPEWVEGEATEVPFDCAPSVPGGAEHKYYENDQDGYFLQFAETTDDPVRRFSQLRADLESCLRDLRESAGPDEPDGLSQAWAVDGIGDEAWMASYWSRMDRPTDEFFEYNLVTVRLVRAGSVVTMVIDGGPSQDDNLNTDPERAKIAAQRLCEALGQECVGDVNPTRIYPEPTGDIKGWLTIDDIVQATDLDNIAEGSKVLPGTSESSPSGWGLAYLQFDPEAEGATSFQRRTYSDPLGEPGGMELGQETAVFPDDETAREHYDELIAGMADAAAEEGTELVSTGTADADGYTATAWHIDDPQVTGSGFDFGVLVQGRTVTVVNYHGSVDADITGDQVLDLLARAADRLAPTP